MDGKGLDRQRGDLGTVIKQDILASFVVFLVALPLCMGIAIASGVPVAAGLISGITGGLVVGVIAGCPLQVSGPAAGLTVIVYEAVGRFGLEMIGVVVLIGGLIQVLAGVLKLGQWFRAVSPAVIQGMLAGIGVLIFASQFHVMVDDEPKGSGIQNLITIPEAILKGLKVPEFDSREVRRFQTEMLRTVGELHRKQVSLYERVAERSPHHEHVNTSQPLNAEATQLDLSDLGIEQTQITESLFVVERRLKEFEAKANKSQNANEIGNAATVAIGHSQAVASADLRGDADHVLKLHVDAVTSLEALMARQKNHHLAAYLGIFTITAIVFWQGLAPNRLKLVPAPLIAVVLAALAAAVFAMPVLYVEIPNNLWKEVHFPSLRLLNTAPWAAMCQTGLLIAIVASAETLLCATAVDQLHLGPRTRYDRELFAQGIGNIVCGFLGALPLTGVIVRSSANVQAGGRTRLSAILHGLWLLIFVAGLAFVLRLIPTSSLAAILVFTGYKLVNPKSIRELSRYGWGEVAIYAATVATIVFTDLLTGVVTGVVLAAGKLLFTFAQLDVTLRTEANSNQMTLSLKGAATFIRLPKLASELEKIPPRADLHVDIEELNYIDHACLDLLMNWAQQFESTDGKLVVDWELLRARFAPSNGQSSRRASSRTSPSAHDTVRR